MKSALNAPYGFGHLNADLLWNEAQSARISRRQLGYGSELP